MQLEGINNFVLVSGYVIFLMLAFSTFYAFRSMNIELIRARLFLKKDFIVKNLVYVIIAGSLLALHEFVEIGREIAVTPFFSHELSESMETLSLIFLVLWLYAWRKLFA